MVIQILTRKTEICLLHPLSYGDPERAKMACEQKASSLDHYSSMLAGVKIKNVPEDEHMLAI